MDTDATIKKGVMASFITVLSFLYNSFGVLFVILLVLMVIDYISGFASAWVRKEHKSRVGIVGILKKIGYVALVVTAALFDLAIPHVANQIGTTLPFSSIFGTIVTCWLISNEALSITENLGEIGVPTPKFLKVALEKFRVLLENIGNKKNGEK